MKINRNILYTLLSTISGVTGSWLLNHQLGLGAVIASGIVGLVAVMLLTPSLAGSTYTASFVGMSSLTIIPTLYAALIAGLIVGIIILSTSEIYKGIGGKGGTTAALSSFITKLLLGILG